MTTDTGGGRRHEVGRLDPFFETWLQTNLQRLYDEALAEPVPEELLRLIAQPRENGRP